jgi:general stress protein 26
MNANVFEKASRIIKTCDAAYVGVIDEDGFPSVSTVAPINQESIFATYFATTLDANKTKRLQKNNRASVCFHTGGDNITLVGETETLTDQETKSRFWQDWFINHFPGGETDPNYCIIKITTKRVSLWVGNEGAESLIDKL